MHLLDELGLWAYVIPEIEPMKNCPQPPRFHPEGDVFVHTALVLDQLSTFAETAGAWDGPPPPALALGALLHDIGKPPTLVQDDRIQFPEHQRVGAEMAGAICRRLRLANPLRRQVEELVTDHMRFMDAQRMKRATLRRFLGREDFDLHLALHWADCMGSHGRLDSYYFCKEQREHIKEEDRQAALLPPPLLNGHDLLALGLEPGPRLGELLEAVREEQLEGCLSSREEALEWVKEKLVI
jgi:poly(A) polymerase